MQRRALPAGGGATSSVRPSNTAQSASSARGTHTSNRLRTMFILLRDAGAMPWLQWARRPEAR